MKVILTDGTKSIPLDSLPPEAWTTLSGDSTTGNLHMYKHVAWIYRAVNMRANAVSAIPLEITRNGEPLDAPEGIIDWWVRMPDLLNGLVADNLLYGAGYLHRERNRVRTLNIRRLQPTTVQPQYDATRGLVGFKRRVGSKQVDLELDDVVYSWWPNRAAEIGPGTPPSEVAHTAASLLYNADDFAAAFFRRGAIMPLLVSLVGGANSSDVQRVQGWFEKLATGISNAFRAIAVSGDFKVQQVGHSIRDLAMPELEDKKREAIAAAFDIPVTMLVSSSAGGLGGGGVRKQDSIDFYNNAVLPDVARLEACLNDQLFIPMGYKLRFMTETLEVYQQQEAEKADKLIMLLNSGVMTIDEVRSQMGLKPLQVAPPPPPVADEDDQPSQPTTEDEMKAWENFTTKRLAKGGKLRTFETEHIPAALKGAVEGAIEVITDANEARAVFANALSWDGY